MSRFLINSSNSAIFDSYVSNCWFRSLTRSLILDSPTLKVGQRTRLRCYCLLLRLLMMLIGTHLVRFCFCYVPWFVRMSTRCCGGYCSWLLRSDVNEQTKWTLRYVCWIKEEEKEIEEINHQFSKYLFFSISLAISLIIKANLHAT